MTGRFLTGPFYAPQGIWSHLRGEGRWTVNVALLFKHLGFDVDIFWDNKIDPEYIDKQEGINFITTAELSSSNKRYDYFFYPVPAWNEFFWMNFISKRVDKVLWGTFFSQNILSSIDNLSQNARAVSAYFSVDEDRIPMLPYMYIDKLGESKFENKTLAWTCRLPYSMDIPDGHLRLLRSIHKAAQSGYSVYFFTYDKDGFFLKSHVKNSAATIEGESLINSMKQLPNVRFIPYLPYDKYMSLLRECSVIFPLTGGSSMPGALLEGMIPVLFSAWFYPNFFKEQYPSGLDFLPSDYSGIPDSLTQDLIDEHIFRLLSDIEYYTERLNLLRQHTPMHYTTTMAANKLSHILEGWQ